MDLGLRRQHHIQDRPDARVVANTGHGTYTAVGEFLAGSEPSLHPSIACFLGRASRPGSSPDGAEEPARQRGEPRARIRDDSRSPARQRRRQGPRARRAHKSSNCAAAPVARIRPPWRKRVVYKFRCRPADLNSPGAALHRGAGAGASATIRPSRHEVVVPAHVTLPDIGEHRAAVIPLRHPDAGQQNEEPASHRGPSGSCSATRVAERSQRWIRPLGAPPTPADLGSASLLGAVPQRSRCPSSRPRRPPRVELP